METNNLTSNDRKVSKDETDMADKNVDYLVQVEGRKAYCIIKKCILYNILLKFYKKLRKF